eukprot:TRINITY_DN4648_c0_g2_i1.p1 TRINITY_DN4648_c0_g2~~TRINITY_DN4648_c0_g2_i1.p1  ORF type:complete len:244 (-),score=39.99 TRINITY_DN4648_c0_g2_i1:123-854(-)
MVFLEDAGNGLAAIAKSFVPGGRPEYLPLEADDHSDDDYDPTGLKSLKEDFNMPPSPVHSPTGMGSMSYGSSSGSHQVRYRTGPSSPTARRQGIFWARWTHPQDLGFIIPESYLPGQPVSIEGPHGPMLVQIPPGLKPGDRHTVRLGPSALHRVTVPEGKMPGDRVSFQSDDGRTCEVEVPPGQKPGDVFEVTPAAVMIEVPPGAIAGDLVVFTSPHGGEMTATVPPGLGQGNYFAAYVQPPS